VIDEEQSAWNAEVTSITLARMRWTTMVAIPLWLASAAVCMVVPALQGRGYAERSFLDAAVYALMLILVWQARRLPASSAWPRRIIWICLAVGLVDMTSWYFAVLSAIGQNSDYVVGVVLAAMIVLLPPREITIALVLNHLLFCLGLLRSDYPNAIVVSGLFDGSAALVMAWLVAWLMYRARHAEFVKARALEASNRELREVMAIAAHDLRSPLLGIRDLLGLARRSVEGGGSVGRALDVAGQSCSDLVQVVTRLVDAHTIEEGRDTLALERHDLRTACRAAGDRFVGTANAKGQRLEVMVPELEANARIDAVAFAQVVDNLIGNALKFSPPGAAVECALFGAGPRWCVEVRDEAPTIPQDEREQLFQKFHRGSARPTGGESSTGLGLFIARRLTEAMGGTISHQARGERGSVFRVELPAV
jgi:signal transduction histidine kinase